MYLETHISNEPGLKMFQMTIIYDKWVIYKYFL